MSDSASDMSDIALVELVRQGCDGASFTELWARHAKAGVRAATKITDRYEADDLVQETFLRIFAATRRGGGPTEAFRPYLYATIRTVSMNWAAHDHDTEALSGDDTIADMGADFDDDALDRSITGRAFTSLKPEWRSVLWYSEVEGMKPREMAVLLGMSANAVSALTARAREGLRAAWLQAHVNAEGAPPACQPTLSRLGAYSRGKLPLAAVRDVQTHLVGCVKCSEVVEELNDTPT